MAQSKPTVLFLAAWYPTPFNSSHGIFIRNHAAALSKYCKVIVAYAYTVDDQEKCGLTKTIVNENFEEWRLGYKKTRSRIPLLSSLLRYNGFTKAYQQLADELFSARINIRAITVNTVFPTALALPIFKRKWAVPHSVIEHWTGYLPEDGNYRGLLLKYFTRRTVATATTTFCVSRKQQLAMQQHGIKGNYQLIFNVVDTKVFKMQEASGTERPLLLSVSSLDDRQKNIGGLLKVIKAVQSNNPDFDFVFVGGNGDLASHYNTRVKELGLHNVLFTGSKPPAEIANLMQKAKAFVLFSNYENMPVVVLEAMACGLPVISTKTGCLDEIVLPTFGKLVNIGDEKTMAKTLEDEIDGKLSFDRQGMSDYISSVASYDVVGGLLYRHYQPLLDA